MIRAALVAAVVLGGCTPLPPTAVAYVPTRANAVCAITEVVDGDTLRLSCTEGRGGTVRLVGFDTPETYRPGCAAEKARGEMAKRFLEAHLRQARVIRPDYQGKDKYKRLLVRLEVDGTDLAQTMTNARLAVPYAGGKRIDWCRKLAA